MKRLFEVDTICRLCLRTDEQVNRLNNTDQKAFIESIIKLKQDNYVPTDDLYICYICSALLTKSFNFMQTVWSAQIYICAILTKTNIITKQLLYCIDRHKTGLNPITLSSVVTYCDNVKSDSTDNTFSNSNTIADIEELDLDLLSKKEKPRKQKNPNINNINHHSKNKLIITISEEEEESDKCNLHEIKVEMCNNFEIDVINAESSDPLTKELNTDEPIPDTKKTVINKKWDLKKSPANENNLIISISDEDEGSDNGNLDEMEVEICNNFEIDGIQIESSDPLTKELNTDACDEPIPKSKRTVRKNNAGLKKEPHIPLVKSKDSTSNVTKKKRAKKDIDNDYESDSTSHKDSTSNETKKKRAKKYIDYDYESDSSSHKDSTSNETKKKRGNKDIDNDYEPDSTSHSEDSNYDSYDDQGKKIKRPKDDRVYPMKCDHCDFELLERRNHYRHYIFSHPNIEYPYRHVRDYACSICGILCTKSKITYHEASHTIQKLKCYLCPKVFTNRRRLQSHIFGVHPKRTYTCDYCSKIFKTSGDIKRHFRTHTGSKPFKCHICGDGFAHSGNRSIHIRAKHQNYKYVPKKQNRAKKVRRNKKHCSTDTEMSSNIEKTVRKTKTIRRSNNQSENTEVTLRKKRKTTKQGSKNKEDEKKIQIVSDINIEQESKNFKNAEIDSDDEILAVTKRKNTQDGPQSKRAEQIDKKKKSNDENSPTEKKAVILRPASGT